MSVILTDKIQPRTTGIALTVVGDTNVSGALTCTNFTASGDVSIGGTLTYEDVTNIDSVGLITARTGVRVTAGGVVVTAGVSTFTDDVKVNSTLTATEGINVTAGVSTFAGNLSVAQNIIHTGDTDTKIHFSAADQISFDTGGTTRVNITSNGNLEMPNDSDYIKIGASGDLQLVHASGISYISDSGSPIEFRSDTIKVASGVGTERIRVLSSGIVNIGESVNNTWIDSIVKVRKDQNDVTRVAVRNENQGSDASSAIAINAYGNSWTLDCGSAAKNSNAFTINVDATSNSNQGTEKFRITTAGRVGIGTNNPASLLDVSATNTTVWPFTVDVSNAYAYSPYPHELQIQNHARDTTGAFAGLYFHSGASADGSYISAARIAAIDSGNYKSDLAFGTRDTNFKERLRIAADGKVGINTITPTHLVHIQHATTPRLVVEDTTNNVQAQICADNTVARIGTVSNHSVSFRVNDTEKASLDSSGVLAINNGSGQSHYQITQSSGNTVKFGIISGSDIELSGSANNSMYFKTNNTERLRITGGGKIGIGTVNPGRQFVVVDDTGSGIGVVGTNAGIYMGTSHSGGFSNNHSIARAAANNYHITGSTAGDLCIAAEAAADILIGTSDSGAPTERMRIQSDGGISFGCAGPVNAEVYTFQKSANNGGTSGQLMYIDHAGTDDHSCVQVRHRGATGSTYRTQISFLDDNADQVGSIRSHGSATQYNTSSDYRLKENAVSITDGIERLKTLKPYRFNFKEDPSTTVDGFFAHEVTAVPEAISGEKDGEEMQGMDYGRLTPLLTAVLQEAIAEIETLKADVAALKSS